MGESLMGPKRQQTTKSRGRPRLPDDQAKRASFTTRLRGELKERLEEEAQIARRSLSEEIEFRLETSVLSQDARERLFGGNHNVALAQILGSSVSLIETVRGTTWVADRETCEAVLKSVPMVLERVLDALQAEQPKNRGRPKTQSNDALVKTGRFSLPSDALESLGRSLSEILGGAVAYPEPIPESTSQTKSSKPKQAQPSGKRRFRKPL
jgi:hypothetical protein